MATPLINDHPFRPGWQDATLCGFEAEDEIRCDRSKVEHRYMLQPPIEIEVWKPHPQRDDPAFPQYQGTVVLDHRRKVQDVLDELNVKLAAEGLGPDEYGFSNMTKYGDPAYISTPWPKCRRIAVFPVTGGSEGHYVHVGIIEQNAHGLERETYRTIGLAKTFRGWDHACRISAAAARLLQA